MKKHIGKIEIINNIDIDVGIKNLKSLKIKREYIDLIAEKLNLYKKFKKIFFTVQNEDVIIRGYENLGRVKNRDIYGYIKFEIVQDMPINLENYIIKYKVLNKDKKSMDLQVILFPKYIEQLCSEIAENMAIKHKYLNINFDIIQKLISKKKLNLNCNKCIIIENLNDEIILNSIDNKKVYNSDVFEKEGNIDYILKILGENIHIFYYGIEDDFFNLIKEKGFNVDKLKLDLKQNRLWIEKTVDKDINSYIIQVGAVI